MKNVILSRNSNIARSVANRGVALPIAIILLGVLLVFTSVSATLMTTEARQTSLEYQNTRAHNAALAYLEVMTNNFNRLFATNQNPSQDDINSIVNSTPSLTLASGQPAYTFNFDAPYIPPTFGRQRTTPIRTPPFDGLNAIERRYVIGATATANTGLSSSNSRVIRELSSYQIPIFQFAAFGFDNLEISPGPRFDIGGRIHVNRHLFTASTSNNINYWGRITTAGEVVQHQKINGIQRGFGAINVYDPNATPNIGSLVPSVQFPDNNANGADFGALPVNWNLNDDPATKNATANRQAPGPTGRVVSNVAPLLLPTQTQGFSSIEIIRRANPNEPAQVGTAPNLATNPLITNRFFYGQLPVQGSLIRILIDDDLGDFPAPVAGGVRAYDLDILSDPAGNDAAQGYSFGTFWLANNPNVRQFDPFGGNDHPDVPAATLPAGTGGLPQTFNNLGGLVNAAPANRRVLSPQTNLVNRQPEFQVAYNPDGTFATQAIRKHTYIKIELLVNNNPPNQPTRYDITPHILNLGITAGPIPVLDIRGTPPAGFSDDLTYANAIPLSDGGSIRRLTDRASDAPENFLPFVMDSAPATPVNIGKFSQSLDLGIAPGLATNNFSGTQTSRVTYWFEPNSILNLQRTFIPFAPQDFTNLNEQVNMTNANPPTTGDNGVSAAAGVQVTGVVSGRINAAGAPSTNPADYPAKFKSLLAKPYFRFTDDFDNRTYIKGSFDPGGDNTPGTADDSFLMTNPFKNTNLTRSMLYGPIGPDNDKRLERFVRRIKVQASRVTTAGVAIGTGEIRTGIQNFTPSTTNNNYPTVSVVAGTTAGAYSVDSRTQILQSPNFWNNTPATTGEAARILAVERQLVTILRRVFPGGIPGFYSLANDANGSGIAGAGPNVIGDNLLDNDLDHLNTGPSGPNQNLNTTTTSAPAAGGLPNGYLAPNRGIVDLQELTPFADIDDSALLRRCLFAPGSLTNAEQERLFPHLTAASRVSLVTRLLKAAEIGTGGRPSDPQLGGAGDPAVAGVPEVARENLIFDWNGDGVIQEPHFPFQTNSAVPESYGVNSSTGAECLGYSAESNLNSLLPSSLRVLHDPPNSARATNTTMNPTTSQPVEIIFVEADASATGALAPLTDPAAAAAIVNPTGQVDPGTTNTIFARETGFNETAGIFQNCFRVNVPFNTFLGKVPVTTGVNSGKLANVREAVSILFQHPLASRVYANALGIDPVNQIDGASGLGVITQNNDGTTEVTNLNLETQLGRRLGLTDAHYSFPGHVSFNLENVTGTTVFRPRLRVEQDRAFPINIYDQREGRHVSRRFQYFGIATAADYYDADIGATNPSSITQAAVNQSQWPNYPQDGTGIAQLEDTQRILQQMELKLPMPSPVCLERRGVMNLTDFNMGNLKRLFRGDFNNYLLLIDAQTTGFTRSNFTEGRPVDDPATPTVAEGVPNGIIDITDNGFMVYFSDRRGDDNNDGIYDMNDVFAENNVLDELDDTFENDPNVNANIPNSPGPKPGDDVLRRDISVETQPVDNVGAPLTPTAVAPARTGEAPHGSIPLNDGFEYFSPNLDPRGQRYTYTYDMDGNRIRATAQSGVMISVAGFLSQLNDTGSVPTGAVGAGAFTWRIVDSAKTGRVRAFRHALRITNAMDIPRWYNSRPDGQDRGFSGLTVVAENPMYNYGNINTIGVRIDNAGSNAPNYSFDDIQSLNGPTRSEDYLQVGNANRPVGEDPIPANFGTQTDIVAFPVSPNRNDKLLHGPLGLISDGMSTLSNGYSDGKSFLSPFSVSIRGFNRLQRAPVKTFQKAAWLTGNGKAGTGNAVNNLFTDNGNTVDAQDNNTIGGLHNFPRFCESFQGNDSQNFCYNGSFIFQFFSHQSNGPWLIGGPDGSLYGAPRRNWNFDVAFTRANGLPPGTPRITFYKNGSYRRIFVENNPN